MQTSVNLHDLVAAVGDAVVVSDVNGAITLWNAGAERMFGYTEAEALGRSLDLMIPERLRAKHWDGYRKTMETGITRYGTEVLHVPAIDKSGRAFSIAFTVAMLHSADNAVSAIVAIIRDDSRRFEKDQAQRKRIAQLEKGLSVNPGAALSEVEEPSPARSGGCPMAHAANTSGGLMPGKNIES